MSRPWFSGRVRRWAPLCLVLLAGTALVRAQTAPPQQQQFALIPVGQTTVAHPFVFQADRKWNAVSLVGSFNSWDKTKNPMVADADGRTWRLALPLNPGRYVYKFVLFGPNENEEKWIVDPRAPLDETDKVNDNSLLKLAPPGYEVPASPSDGITAVSALLHPHGVRDVSYDRGQIELSLRARPNDLSQVWVRSGGRRYPMKVTQSDEFYAFYSAKIPWDRRTNLTYNFELQDGSRIKELGADGLRADGLRATSRPFTILAQGFQPYLLSNPSEPLQMSGPLTTQFVAGPAWARNQPIYEVNLDLYKFPKGTALREYEKHLPVLQQIGVGIVWFMPLHPRGEKKGFGSPYAVRDYTDINPDLGTKDDFRHLVQTAHALGLRVLMDWVPNHTSWDNPMIEAHPEFYVKDAQGHIAQAQSWADTAQLDYGKPGAWNQALWNVMRDNMTGWVRDFGVDGFRCDVAGSNGRVPVEFWNWLRPQLNAVRPVFMLAEADNPEVHPAFDMTYSWNLPPVLWDICAGRRPATAIDDQLRTEARDFPSGAIRMRFLDNHDWHGHADWGWGDKPPVDTRGGLAVAPLMLLCATLPGKPLLYNGQEMSFLKADPSADAQANTRSSVWPFYKRLLELYQSQDAVAQGRFSKLASNDDRVIYAFTREQAGQRVLVVVNLSDKAQNATLQSASLQSATLAGQYLDWFGGGSVRLSNAPSLSLAPWSYRVYVGHTQAAA